MQELVGRCKECKKQIFCNDGFINGVVLEDKHLICFNCFDKEQEQSVDHND
ncbi:hypothetical protein [Paenibacillus sp. Soil522]|uniref:hypothetical protein n=1 Tax=Paenibacillus sp. Soil522 TaxID=1736388 RepID=UPI000B050765|nr:hypothetical protein [Paenibacillus sp. Soil522]